MTHDEAVRHLCWRVIDLAGRRKTAELETLALSIAGARPRKASRDWEALEAEVLNALQRPLEGKSADPAPGSQPNSNDRHMVLKAGMELPSGVYKRSWPLIKEYGPYALNLVYEPAIPS